MNGLAFFWGWFLLTNLAWPAGTLFADDIVFIVNADNPTESISSAELKDYYFKKKRNWPDGASVRFIDRTPDAKVRQVFLSTVLNKKAEDLELYWIQQKLNGDSAPLKERSESMTIQFVSSFKGAIGYVSASTALFNKNIKVIKLK